MPVSIQLVDKYISMFHNSLYLMEENKGMSFEEHVRLFREFEDLKTRLQDEDFIFIGHSRRHWPKEREAMYAEIQYHQGYLGTGMTSKHGDTHYFRDNYSIFVKLKPKENGHK